MSQEIDTLRANYEAAKTRAEAAQQEREHAFDNLREAKIAAIGCKVIGFTVDFCTTCGRDANDLESCPHWPPKPDSNQASPQVKPNHQQK